MINGLSDSALINYSEFIELCPSDDYANFGGFRVSTDGLYVIDLAEGNCLPSTEEAAITKGLKSGDLPALAFPCTLAQLREFAADVGLVGCIDEDAVEEWIAAMPVPSGSHERKEHNDTTGKRAWQAAILEGWEDITKKRGDRTTARHVLAWCKTSGPSDVFGCEQPEKRESLCWIDSSEGNVHTVTLARIGTVISEWRKRGILPAKK
jgi:hypothetical protein